MFSSKRFIVSGHILRSLIYFDFMFVYGVKEPSNLIFLCRAVQFAQHHLLETVFPQFHSFASFVRLIALGHLYIFFGITHIQILCPFFNCIIRLLVCFCIKQCGYGRHWIFHYGFALQLVMTENSLISLECYTVPSLAISRLDFRSEISEVSKAAGKIPVHTHLR